MQPAPRNLWIPLLIAFIIGCGLIGSMFFPPFVVWGVITMALFGAILIGHPQHVLFFFWVWASFRPLIRQMVNNLIVKSSDDLFLAATVGICFAGYVRRRTDTSRIAGIFKILTALLGVTLASFLVNRSPILNTINFIIAYLAFPFVFYVAYTTLDRRHWRYLFGFAIGLMLIQFALNVGWRLGVNPLPNTWRGTSNAYDMAQGTFGTSAYVAYFMVAVIFLLFSALRLGNKYKPWIILLLIVTTFQFYMTYTNHAYGFFAVLLPVYLVIAKQSMKVRIASVAIIALGIMAFSFLAAWDNSREGLDASVNAQLTMENIEFRWDKFLHGPKIELITRIAVQNATRDPLLWLLGHGPGSGLSAIGMKRGSDFAWEYLGAFVANSSQFDEAGMSSISGSFYSGILSIWSELGVLGYVLYTGQYIYLFLHVVLRLRKNQYRDVFQRMLAEGFVMALLTFLLGNFLQDIFWVSYFAGGLWIWAAMVWDPVAEEEEEKTDVRDQTSAVGFRPVGLPGPSQPNPQSALVVKGWRRVPLR